MGNFEMKSIDRTVLRIASVHRHKMHFPLVSIQTEMWNYYRDDKLKQQITEGKSLMLGQSVLTSWKGCMGSQAVYRSPSEKR